MAWVLHSIIYVRIREDGRCEWRNAIVIEAKKGFGEYKDPCPCELETWLFQGI